MKQAQRNLRSVRWVLLAGAVMGLGWFFLGKTSIPRRDGLSDGGGGPSSGEGARTPAPSAKRGAMLGPEITQGGAPSVENSREAFVRAGWSEVEALRPDEEVLALRALEGEGAQARQERERAVTLQLQSAVLGDELVPAAARWVRNPQAGERVREAALEALGRSRTESAQEELARLWQEGGGDLSPASRRRVLELLHAGSRVADSRTQVLLQVLRDDRASEADRDQAAYSLALGAALKVELERELLRALTEGPARVRFLKRLEQIQTSAAPPAAHP